MRLLKVCGLLETKRLVDIKRQSCNILPPGAASKCLQLVGGGSLFVACNAYSLSLWGWVAFSIFQLILEN